MGLKIDLDDPLVPLTLTCDGCGCCGIFLQADYVAQRHAAVVAGWKQSGENYEFWCPTCPTPTGKRSSQPNGDIMKHTSKRRGPGRPKSGVKLGPRLSEREIQEIVNGTKPKGGKFAKQKGDRFERECVELFIKHGLWAERVPLSGAAGGSFGSDIQVTDPLESVTVKYECKSRARAWGDLYGWLAPPDVHALLIKRDRSEPLIVMTLKDYLEK